MYKKVTIIIIFTLACILVVTVAGCDSASEKSGKEITIGNKDFTEQYIFGQLMKQLLEERGYIVQLKSGRSTSCLREGMEFGDIDIYADYTGTAWMVHLSHKYVPGMDNNEVYRLVKEEEEGNGFVWLNPVWNNNTYALASWIDFTEKHSLKTLSDLASLYREKQGDIQTCVGLEFSTRPDGLPALENFYDFRVAAPVIEPVAIPLESLKNRESEVAMVFGTDAEVSEYGWHLYEDDKSFFPPYDLTPYVRQEVIDKYPEIKDILNELVATFPGGGLPATSDIVARCQKVWQELNARVDIDKMKAGDVAHEYLIEQGLIKK